MNKIIHLEKIYEENYENIYGLREIEHGLSYVFFIGPSSLSSIA